MITPCAVLVVDMQNGFLHPSGSLASRGQVIADSSDLIERVCKVVGQARAAGVPVIYTRHQFRPNLVDAPPALVARYPQGAAPLVAGSWDAAIVDELSPTAGEVVIDKNRYDAFLHTETDMILRSLGAARLMVAGVVTNMCVESTVRSAEQRDFEVVVVSDGCGAYDPALHHASLTSMAAGFATVEPAAVALDRLP